MVYGMIFWRNACRAGVLATFLTGAIGGSAMAQESIALAPGDRLVFSILGAPEARIDATIGIEGTVYLPMIGEIPAAGRTIAALRQTLVSTLTDRPYRLVQGGEEQWRSMQAEEIFLDVAAYRPVYVSGDIRAPSELPFRPGMTVRQALAAVGGVALLREEATGDDVMDVLAERSLLRARIDLRQRDITRLEALLARSEAALSGTAETEGGAGEEAAEAETPAPQASALSDLGTEFVSVWSDLRELTDNGNSLVLEETRNRLDVLENLLEANEQSVGFDEDEFARAERLSERGVVPASAVVEARRDLLDSSTRALQTAGEVLRLRLEMTRVGEEAEADRRRERLDLLESLIDANTDLELLYREFEAADLRLAMAGTGTGMDDAGIEISVIRGTGAETVEQPADPDMRLLPGDVVSVQLDLPGVPSTPRLLGRDRNN